MGNLNEEIEEPKTINIVLVYSAYVPADMTKEQLEEAVYAEFEAESGNGFQLSVLEYDGSEDRNIDFLLDSTHVGESFQLAIG